MTEVLVPTTGEMLDLTATPTDEIAASIADLADFEGDIRSFKRAAVEELAARLDHEGKRSAAVGDWKLEANAPTEKNWDVPGLQTVLLRLVMHDLISKDKALACIRWEPRVVWAEVKTLLSDPRTAEQIRTAYREEPTTRSVRVRHA